MQRRYRLVFLLFAFALLSPLFVARDAAAALAIGLIDRKFPKGQFCPIETRGASLLTFVAPANGAVQITFSASNQFIDTDGFLSFNDPRIDNLLLMTLQQWNENHTTCASECFTNDFLDPEGPGAPAYPTDTGSLAEIAYFERFLSDPHAAPHPAWQGGTWSASLTAPADDASGSECVLPGSTGGGSLQLGSPLIGDELVSAAVVLGGLAPGTTYVVFCWFYVRETDEVTPAELLIIVDETNIVTTEKQTFGAVKARFR